MRKRLASALGFTLPELLLMAAILSYTFSVILLSFITSMAINEDSRNLTVANSHAQFVMEEIKNTAFGSIGTNITTGNWTWNTAAVGTHGLTAIKNESITTTYTGSTLLDIIVTVYWTNANGRARNKSLRTLLGS